MLGVLERADTGSTAAEGRDGATEIRGSETTRPAGSVESIKFPTLLQFEAHLRSQDQFTKEVFVGLRNAGGSRAELEIYPGKASL